MHRDGYLITCLVDGHEHVVTEAAIVAGREQGQAAAACGHVVKIGSLTAPFGPPCTPCNKVLADPSCKRKWTPDVPLQGSHRHRTPTKSLLGRVLHRHAA